MEIHLLGPPRILVGGATFILPRRQARALLFYLANARTPISRDQLIFLFWPDETEAKARRNLTRLVSYLRQELPQPETISVTRESLHLNPEHVWVDAERFSRMCSDSATYGQAVALYRGNFLAGFSLASSPEYDLWLTEEQSKYEAFYLKILADLVRIHQEQRDYVAGIEYAQRYLAVDELAEEIHRDLISLYGAIGKRTEAQRQYEKCVTVLERELGVAPLPETRAAYEAAREGFEPPQPSMKPKPEWTTLPGLDLPLIGRDEPWAELEKAYHRNQNGGVIFLSGEAGVGKSRLMEEFATAQTGLVLTGNSYATGQALPYQPLAQALRLALEIPERWRHLSPIWLTEVSRVLPELSAQFTDLPQPVEVDPQQGQVRLFSGLAEVFVGLAVSSPILLCLDDVHWADEATLDWLVFATDRINGSGVCILATYRTQEAERLTAWQHALIRAGMSANVQLAGLSEMALVELLQKAGAARAPIKDLAKKLRAATGGNAYFVLETIREMLESGQDIDDAADLPLSQTVRDTLRRRVKRLSPLGQQIASVAAVLSPQLRVEALIETSGRSELETVTSLDELVTHQLLRTDGEGFSFQHDLAREAIYQELSPWRRRLLHRRAAEGLERLHRADLALFFPSLAYHWRQTLANDSAIDPVLGSKAVYFLQKAGEQAVQNSANQEAIDHFEEAIALVTRLPDTPDALQQELNLQIALYAPLGVAKGWGSPEIADAFNRARELCEQIGDPDQLFLVLYGLWGYNITRSNLDVSHELAEQCLTLAQSVNDRALLMEAHRLIDETLFFQGDFVRAQQHLQEGYRLYDPNQHHSHATIYGQDPGVAFLGYGSWLLWLLGYPDQARKMSRESLALAQRFPHLGSQAYALTWAAFLHFLGHDAPASQKQAEAAIALSTEQGFGLFLAVATALHGWALAEQGQAVTGIAQVTQVLIASQAAGADARLKMFGLTAKAHAEVGQIEEGLGVLEEALTLVEEYGERWWEAELYRLRGELLRLQGSAEDLVEAEFRRAVGIAKQQTAKSLELRAVMSLCRLWQSQGKRPEAHLLLAKTYDWFTEGFDSPDLIKAQEFLRELS